MPGSLRLAPQGELTRMSHTPGPERTPRRRNLVTGMPVTREARALIAVTGCRIRDTDLPPVAVNSSRDRTPTARMSPRGRRADGAMAGTAWNAGLRPAQRPAGPRRRRPQLPGWLPSRHLPPTDEMAGSRRRRGFLPVGLDTTAPRAAGGSLASAFTERRHVAPTVTNGVCHSQVRIPPNAEIPAGTAPPRNGESFPPPAFGGLCRPEAGVPSRPRRRAAAS